jgi:tRNA-Thr(GGU) m(6)t(6)A37 methyltransferase TsaA
MEKIEFKPIGYIKSEYKTIDEIPRQSILAPASRAKIILDSRYQDGLLTLDESEHIIILFHFHKTVDCELRFIPRHSKKKKLRGVFATRSPRRPNPIGLSVVRLLGICENEIEFEGVDMLDGTPVIDIKPYSRGLEPD